MLILSPEPSKIANKVPKTNTDITPRSKEILSLDDPFQLPKKDVAVLRVDTGHFKISASVSTLRKADRLMVTFTGLRPFSPDPLKARRPMFERREWDALFKCPILAISDPQTEVAWRASVPRSGLYMGTFKHDLVPEVLALINKVCDELGISRDKVVMYGAATGGTAAMLVGARRREGTGIIASCPLLRPDKYFEGSVNTLARAMDGELADWENLAREAPWRVNPLTALRDGLNDGHDIRVVVAQNRVDKRTINRHFAGLWRRFDIPPEGGVSPDGRMMSLLYEGPGEAHGHEPLDCSKGLITAAYEFFDKPPVPVLKPARKLSKAKLAARSALSAETDMSDVSDAKQISEVLKPAP